MTDTIGINISEYISISCSLMVDTVGGLPTSCPFSRAFHFGVFAVSFEAQEAESPGLGFSHSKTCALLERQSSEEPQSGHLLKNKDII